MRAVVSAQERLGMTISGGGREPVDASALRRAGRAAANPVRFAPPKVRGALAQYWCAFRDEGRRWRSSTQPGLICRLERSEQRALVARLEAEAPGLEIHLAPYPVPTAMAIAPRTIVLGMPAADRDTAQLARAVIVGAIEMLP